MAKNYPTNPEHKSDPPKRAVNVQHRLQMLRDRHSDHRTHHDTLKSLEQLPKTETAGQSFTTSWDGLTPAGHKKVFRRIYTFLALYALILVIWSLYRYFFHLPVWFDEGVAKALIFGTPVVFFASNSPFISREIGLSENQILPGLFLGIAVGGLYGFIGLFLEVSAGTQFIQANLFTSAQFWWTAFLALLTAWWESLFFFGLPVQFIRSAAPWFSDTLLGAIVAIIFLLFHLQLRFMVAGFTPQFVASIGVLTLFAIGQFILYTRTKNLYTLVLSHLLWGLVIEIYAH